MTGVPIRRGNLDTDTQRENDVKTGGEDSHLEAEASGLD